VVEFFSIALSMQGKRCKVLESSSPLDVQAICFENKIIAANFTKEVKKVRFGEIEVSLEAEELRVVESPHP
jgi:hypothetical protein